MHINFSLYCILICLIFSCRNVDSKVSDVHETEPVTYDREEEKQENPVQIFYSLLKDVPCSFKLKSDQLKDFSDFFNSFPFTQWFAFNSVLEDSLVRIDVRINPSFSFVDSFHQQSYFRSGYSFSGQVFTLKAISDPDTLSVRHIPMLNKRACRSLFNQPDSVYLFYSFPQKLDPYNPNKVNWSWRHLFYNHHRASYVWMSIDTSGQIIDSVTLCTYPDTNSSFEFLIPTLSAIQVIRQNRWKLPNNDYKEISYEEKRFYIEPEGKIHDWTSPSISMEKYCQSIPEDSTFNHHMMNYTWVEAVPLPLDLEVQVNKVLLDSYNAHTKQILAWPDINGGLRYFLNSIQFMNGTTGIIIGSLDQSMLVVFDKSWKVRDAGYISYVENNAMESYAFGRLSPDLHIYRINNYVDMDTLDEWVIERNKIISVTRKQPMLTVPYSDLDQYFPFKEVREFDMRVIGNRFPETNYFPDSVSECLNEVMKLNGDAFYGRNYSVTHASNGLTYYTFLSEGEVSMRLNMRILDQNNVFRRGTFELASSGGDEGFYAGTWGKFVNDSTYMQTGISGYDGITVDSSITIFRISHNGLIFIDSDLSEIYGARNRQ